MRSAPITRFGALTQSVFPAVLTTKLPSLPSKVLPGRLARALGIARVINAAVAAKHPIRVRVRARTLDTPVTSYLLKKPFLRWCDTAVALRRGNASIDFGSSRAGKQQELIAESPNPGWRSIALRWI